MTTIATFATPEDAHLFRTFLESNGIHGYLKDEFVSQLFWIYNNATGGVRFDVADEDVEDSVSLYHEYMAALRSGPYPENTVRGWPIVAVVTLLLGVPLMFFGFRKSDPR